MFLKNGISSQTEWKKPFEIPRIWLWDHKSFTLQKRIMLCYRVTATIGLPSKAYTQTSMKTRRIAQKVIDFHDNKLFKRRQYVKLVAYNIISKISRSILGNFNQRRKYQAISLSLKSINLKTAIYVQTLH